MNLFQDWSVGNWLMFVLAALILGMISVFFAINTVRDQRSQDEKASQIGQELGIFVFGAASWLWIFYMMID